MVQLAPHIATACPIEQVWGDVHRRNVGARLSEQLGEEPRAAAELKRPDPGPQARAPDDHLGAAPRADPSRGCCPSPDRFGVAGRQLAAMIDLVAGATAGGRIHGTCRPGGVGHFEYSKALRRLTVARATRMITMFVADLMAERASVRARQARSKRWRAPGVSGEQAPAAQRGRQWRSRLRRHSELRVRYLPVPVEVGRGLVGKAVATRGCRGGV